MKILITGGAGFIGSNLTRQALTRGWHVVVLDNLSTGHPENLHGLNIDFIHGSLLDPTPLAQACHGVDTIIHLAALGSVPRSITDPITTHHTNTTGTLLLLEQARRSGVNHLIVTSSSSVYGLNPALPKHERDWTRPISPYAVTKLTQEHYTLAYQQSFGMTTLALRLFNVYGPRQQAGHPYAAVIPTFIHALLNNQPLTIHGDGTTTRDFTYVDTVCDTLIDATNRRLTHPEPINLALGTNTSLLTLINTLHTITGTTPTLIHTPPRTSDPPHSQADPTLLHQLFPTLTPTNLTTGLQQTIQWHLNQHNATG